MSLAPTVVGTSDRRRQAPGRRVRLADAAAAALELPLGTEGLVRGRLAPFGPYLVAVDEIADDLLILEADEFSWLATTPLGLNDRHRERLGSAT